MPNFNAAVVQMRSTTNVLENIEAMNSLVRQAKAAGANYIQTPEMTGLIQQDRNSFFQTLKAESDDPLVARAAKLAAELKIYLHIGSTPVAAGDGRAANRALVFSPRGEVIGRYDKIHMFDVDLDNGERWRESAVYQPGTKTQIVDVLGEKLALTICYDLRFPHLHDAYARAGATILTGPSCFTRQTGQAHWHVLMRARAIETGSFMIAAAQGGDHEDGRSTFGHSIIVNPWGEIIAEIVGEEPGFALATINTEETNAARAKVPNLKNRQDFALPLQSIPNG